MAGRQISVTDEALGTVRVMKTIGMMGEVVARLPRWRSSTTPRARRVSQLLERAGRVAQAPRPRPPPTPDAPFEIKGVEPAPIDDSGGRGGNIQLASLKGIVIDNQNAKRTGKWSAGSGLQPHVGADYQYAGKDSGAKALFEFTVPSTGNYEVRFATAMHENRASNTPLTVRSADGEKKLTVKPEAARPNRPGMGFVGRLPLRGRQTRVVEVSTDGVKRQCAH